MENTLKLTESGMLIPSQALREGGESATPARLSRRLSLGFMAMYENPSVLSFRFKSPYVAKRNLKWSLY